ncbi:MAG: hypothetical protein H6724_00755 [Sandaracinus sp.]|nr:hypothetical protein [Myxococcales bacterium]MCB9617959.1 hypothetical protein [Sandaracinus sp.]
MRRLLFSALTLVALACGSEHADGAPVETAPTSAAENPTSESPTVGGPVTPSSTEDSTTATGVRGGSCGEDRDCNWMACGCRCRFYPRGARVRCPPCDEEEPPRCGRARCVDGVCIAPD